MTCSFSSFSLFFYALLTNFHLMLIHSDGARKELLQNRHCELCPLSCSTFLLLFTEMTAWVISPGAAESSLLPPEHQPDNSIIPIRFTNSQFLMWFMKRHPLQMSLFWIQRRTRWNGAQTKTPQPFISVYTGANIKHSNRASDDQN